MNVRTEREALAAWKVDVAVPRTFNQEVWRRIEQRRSVGLAALFAAWLNGAFARPVVAVSYAAVALAIGLAAGNIQGSSAARKERQALETRYVQSIDPYSKPLAR